jgi:hypothetical protein
MRIVILSEKDRAAVYAALNTQVERSLEAAEDETDERDRASLVDEARTYRLVSRRFMRRVR